MPDARTCPDCGSALPPRAPEGLCPRCLLRAGLGGDSLALDRTGEVAATVELAAEAHGGGVLATIAASLGPVPRVLLRDTDLGPEPPLVRPGAEAGDRRLGPLPDRRRDRPRRHGGRAQGPRPRPRPRRRRQGAPRRPPRQRRHGPPVRRGGADRRPAPAPRDRADLRAGHLRRPPAVLLDEAGQGPHAGRSCSAAATDPADGPAPVPRDLRGRSRRRWPMRTPAG